MNVSDHMSSSARLFSTKELHPGFYIIDPVATIVAVVEKRVLTQKIFFEQCWRLGVSL